MSDDNKDGAGVPVSRDDVLEEAASRLQYEELRTSAAIVRSMKGAPTPPAVMPAAPSDAVTQSVNASWDRKSGTSLNPLNTMPKANPTTQEISSLRWLLNITTEFDRKDVRTRQAARLLDDYSVEGKTNRENLESLWRRLYDQENTSRNVHPATVDLVARFSSALLEKLAAAEKKYGYSDGWLQADWMDECRAKLLEHVAKGDPRDVAAYCAFLWHHGESTAALSQTMQPQAKPAAGEQAGAVADEAAAWDFGLWLVKLMRLADDYHAASEPAKHRFRRSLYDHARNARMHWRAHEHLDALAASGAAIAAREQEVTEDFSRWARHWFGSEADPKSIAKAIACMPIPTNAEQTK